MSVRPSTKDRPPLTRERIIEAAVTFADEHGLEALSMRKLGHQLGVEAMSLYNHVEGKEGILDGMVEYLFAEIGVVEVRADWKDTARAVAVTARDVFARHSWAVPLVVGRDSFNEASFALMDFVLGLLAGAGYDPESAHHAWHVISSHVMGYALQENGPFAVSGDDHDHERVERLLKGFADRYPHLTAVAPYLMQCAPAEEFEYGLDIILSGIEARKPR